jgi:thymidylate kinase
MTLRDSHKMVPALRHVQAWLRPNGLFCVVLGPDGVGKSTTIKHLHLELQALLGPCRKERWRPGVIRKVTPGTSNRMPHAKSPRGSILSILSVLGLALDFNIGYVVSAYPAMVRSETIIFDRYFHDLLVDPKRYRYTGPMWLPRLISRFVPPRKAIFIILDANEEVILNRKQELPLHELQRQRAAYRIFGSLMPDSMIISTEKPLDEIVSEVINNIMGILATRNNSSLAYRKRMNLNSAVQPTSSTRSQR